jgi:hypothetical protein
MNRTLSVDSYSLVSLWLGLSVSITTYYSRYRITRESNQVLVLSHEFTNVTLHFCFHFSSLISLLFFALHCVSLYPLLQQGEKDVLCSNQPPSPSQLREPFNPGNPCPAALQSSTSHFRGPEVSTYWIRCRRPDSERA